MCHLLQHPPEPWAHPATGQGWQLNRWQRLPACLPHASVLVLRLLGAEPPRGVRSPELLLSLSPSGLHAGLPPLGHGRSVVKAKPAPPDRATVRGRGHAASLDGPRWSQGWGSLQGRVWEGAWALGAHHGRAPGPRLPGLEQERPSVGQGRKGLGRGVRVGPGPWWRRGAQSSGRGGCGALKHMGLCSWGVGAPRQSRALTRVRPSR